MKLTIEKDDGDTIIYTKVTDLYIVIRQNIDHMFIGQDQVYPVPEVHSYSWGSDLRELVKEIQQSLIELQDYLKEQRNGGSS